MSSHGYKPASPRRMGDRLRWLEVIFVACGVVIAVKLFFLQVVNGAEYRLLATDEHELQQKLIPERGKILVRDRADDSLHPLATNQDSWTIYAVPREMKDKGDVAKQLAPVLPAAFSASTTEATLAASWAAHPDDPYEPIAKGLSTDEADAISTLALPGIGLVKGWARYYPEADVGGQVIGFVRTTDDGTGKGSYGIEGAFDTALAGKPGFLDAQKDAGGRRITGGDGAISQAVNGSDVILTLDRTIQHEACTRLVASVQQHQADGGTVVIMDPNTGAVLAMCSTPDFNPASYGATKDLQAFNNPATFAQYEPGSVFKAFTMAVGLDQGKITPKTTYTDTGSVKIDTFTIKDADGLSHGVQTMTDVLNKSLNTGTIFVEQLVGRENFQNGIERFGFGKPTGIELKPEAKGDISGLDKKGSVFAATGSFGQGLSVTPIQLAAAYASLANGGTLMRPYIVDEIVHPDGTREKTKPQTVGRVVSQSAARLVTGMLVSVVENGEGKHAAVPGYYVAGKTGTAQVPDSKNGGYLKDVTIGGFAGYAPAEDPRFVMIVKIDHPRDVQWAESSAAPLWGDIAKFLLSYLQVPMERDPAATPPLPALPSGTSTTPVAATGTTE